MGSVPIHIPKLLGISALVEILGIIAYILASDFKYRFIFLLAGIIYFFFIYLKYRNTNARHHHETETKKNIFNIRKVDNFIKNEKGLSNSTMVGANNKKVSGQSVSETVLNRLNNFK
jgi:hypothetical protein